MAKRNPSAERPFAGGVGAQLLLYFVIIWLPSIPAGLVSQATGAEMRLAISAFTVVFGVVALAVLAMRLRKKGHRGFFAFRAPVAPEILACVAVALVADVVLVIMGTGIDKLVAPTLGSVTLGLAAGIGEETAHRAAPLTLMMRGEVTRRKIVVASIVTSVIFALTHILNVASGASLVGTALQLVSAVCAGLFFAAIYLRTGSIVIPMVFHALHDMLNFMVPEQATGVVTQASFSAVQLGGELFFAVLVAALAAYMLRPSKLGEIQSVWAEAWSK